MQPSDIKVKEIIYSLCDDGEYHSPFGIPSGTTPTGKTRVMGYALHNGAHTFGTRFATKGEATEALEDYKARVFTRLICEIEKGLWLGCFYQDDTPRLYWFDDLTGDTPLKAGRGELSKELPHTLKDTSAKWGEAVTAWLKDEFNDCLRARGDVRYRTASHAQVLIASEVEASQY